MAPRKTPPSAKQPDPAAVTPEQPSRFFVVNPGGTVHEVDAAHYAWRLTLPNWRIATPEEIAAYCKRD